MNDLIFHVSDLTGRPGERRDERGSLDVDLAVGESTVRAPAAVEVTINGMSEGVLADFRSSTTVHLVCTRCLSEWEEDLAVAATQVFEPNPDEDGYFLGPDNRIDLSGPVRDEIALAIPFRPLCQSDCAGLCPTCGSDLNKDPCEGHDELSSSPFAALQGLLDNDSSDL